MRNQLAAAGLSLALGAGGLALTPATVHAAPARSAGHHTAPLAAPAFNASGSYQIFQSNSTTVNVNLSQDGSGNLFGSATAGGTVATVETGAVDGTSISFILDWNTGSRGRYTGSLGSDRRLSGTTVDLTHPGSQATWFTTRTF